jgi:hypothetical protein
MTGAAPWQPETLHLASDYAAAQIFEQGRRREDVIADLEPLRRLWPNIELFLIEISSYREYTASFAGEEIVVNNFSDRDQTAHASMLEEQFQRGQSAPKLEIRYDNKRPEEMIKWMGRLKAALGGRSVIWVSHMRHPGDDPRYEHPNAVRLRVADTLRTGAARQGDGFFDPTTIANEMGADAFFIRDGDIDHLAEASTKRLAGVYTNLALGQITAQTASAVSIGNSVQSLTS